MQRRASLVAQPVKNLPAMRKIWVQSLLWKIRWRRAWQPIPIFLPGEFHGQRSLASYNPQGHKESDRTEPLTHTHTHTHTRKEMGFPGSSDGKESACNAGDLGSIPGPRRYPGEGNGYPFQYSFLENSMHRGAWQATVHRVTKSWTWLSN